ncbi:MAG TPA: VOC family protein [Candidatus Acidoferrales bacterium]|nr:VOC family protein [Candidatus Acidoferrales bacterium]
MMKKLTPVLFVEEIEPCLPFWVDRLGFQKTVEVPEGAKLGFVILAKDSVEIMYQSHASAEKDVPGLVKWPLSPTTFLYVEVAGLDDILQRLKGVPAAVPERNTLYGAREIGVREPGGNVVVFAEMGAAATK